MCYMSPARRSAPCIRECGERISVRDRVSGCATGKTRRDDLQWHHTRNDFLGNQWMEGRGDARSHLRESVSTVLNFGVVR